MNENAEKILGLYQAFGQNDMAHILEMIAPDAVWEFEAPPQVPWSGTYHGPKEVAFYFEALRNNCENPKVQLTEVIAEGDCVVTIGRFAATAKNTDRAFTTAICHFWKLRDGLIIRHRNFAHEAALVEAFRDD